MAMTREKTTRKKQVKKQRFYFDKYFLDSSTRNCISHTWRIFVRSYSLSFTNSSFLMISREFSTLSHFLHDCGAVRLCIIKMYLMLSRNYSNWFFPSFLPHRNQILGGNLVLKHPQNKYLQYDLAIWKFKIKCINRKEMGYWFIRCTI